MWGFTPRPTPFFCQAQQKNEGRKMLFPPVIRGSRVTPPPFLDTTRPWRVTRNERGSCTERTFHPRSRCSAGFHLPRTAGGKEWFYFVSGAACAVVCIYPNWSAEPALGTWIVEEGRSKNRKDETKTNRCIFVQSRALVKLQGMPRFDNNVGFTPLLRSTSRQSSY